MVDKKNNTGSCNTGDYNTGNCNAGSCNTGNCNAGSWNTGDCNTGSCNMGSRNTGDRNTGNWNTGDCNAGSWNTGNWNTGRRNMGNCNMGNCNVGNCNTGNRNTGNWNTGNWNTGMFNEDEPNARFFGKDTNIKMSEFLNSEMCPSYVNFLLTEWVDSSKMTDKEKEENPCYTTTGGHLKKYDYKEAWSNFWKQTTEENRQKFLNLPNFDAEIFFRITGIDVGKRSLSGKEVEVTLDGVKYVAVLK